MNYVPLYLCLYLHKYNGITAPKIVSFAKKKQHGQGRYQKIFATEDTEEKKKMKDSRSIGHSFPNSQ